MRHPKKEKKKERKKRPLGKKFYNHSVSRSDFLRRDKEKPGPGTRKTLGIHSTPSEFVNTQTVRLTGEEKGWTGGNK